MGKLALEGAERKSEMTKKNKKRRKHGRPSAPRAPSQLYHYTVVNRLPVIEDYGALVPSVVGIEPGERRAVWATTSPVWDNTANKFYIGPDGSQRWGTRETTELFYGGLARIVLPPEAAPLSWSQFVRLSGISSARARQLVRSGRQFGSVPANWRVSFDPIPVDQWLQVEVFYGGEWVRREEAGPMLPAASEALGVKMVNITAADFMSGRRELLP